MSPQRMTLKEFHLDHFSEENLLSDLSLLTDRVDKKGFREQVLKTLSHAGTISNFAVFTFTELGEPQPKLSIAAGGLSDYQLKRNAKDLENFPSYTDFLKNLIDQQGGKNGEVVRYRPDDDTTSDIREVFDSSNIIEKLCTFHFGNDIAYYINYFRSTKDGDFTATEIERLSLIIPIIDNLLILRHKVVGVDDHQLIVRQGLIKNLHSRKISPFDKLSKREVDICDCIVKGLSTEGIGIELGISESSVKTMRRRAYDKLNIHSKSNLFAIVLNIQI